MKACGACGVWCVESLMQFTCNKKHFAPVTHFCFTCVKQIMVCVQVWQACNRVTWIMPGKLCFACNRTTLPACKLDPSVHAVWFVTTYDKPRKIRINTTHACTHMGGRGCACALAFLLYYLHPPRNFFCTNVPRMGSVCAHGYARVDTPMFDTPTPPHPPHSMASFPRVCVCSLKEECLAFMWLPSRRCQ